jgi:FkbM family methyltransferase
VAFRIRRFAREHRRWRLVRRIVAFCDKFLHGYYNEGHYDLDRNGEGRLIEAVAAYRGAPLVVLDVGANKGEWTVAVLSRSPAATVVCFELIPATAKELGDRFADVPNVTVHGFGLSSRAEDIEVCWNPAADDTSAIAPRRDDPLFAHASVTTIVVKVDTGDAVVERHGMPKIDLLKIDVEGHEIEVLRGFARTLGSADRKPLVIQFEYGVTYLPPRHTLREAYDILAPHSYAIGRLYPDGVAFKPYEYADDHFRMGNYVAVQAGDPIAARLSRFQSI